MENNVLGIGSDIIEIDRIEKLVLRFGDIFLSRIFTKEEQAYCKKHKNSAPRFAGRFAAKEAIAKALGKGFGKYISWTDINILPDSHGKPTVTLSTRVNSHFNSPQILLTISHNKQSAFATALWLS